MKSLTEAFKSIDEAAKRWNRERTDSTLLEKLLRCPRKDEDEGEWLSVDLTPVAGGARWQFTESPHIYIVIRHDACDIYTFPVTFSNDFVLKLIYSKDWETASEVVTIIINRFNIKSVRIRGFGKLECLCILTYICKQIKAFNLRKNSRISFSFE